MDSQIRPKDILLIEDNPTDILLTKEAFRECNFPVNLHIAEDGIQGLAFLFKEREYIHAVSPELILLDLNMPKKDGKEVLEEIKLNPLTRHIPVIILSTSSDLQDITECYALGANSYISKPVDFEDFVRTIMVLRDYWFSISTLPFKTH